MYACASGFSRDLFILAPRLGIALLLVSWLFGCDPPPREVKATRLQMGTIVEITVLGPDKKSLLEAVDAAFAEIGRIEALMSSFREDSDVGRINRSAGGGPVAVDPEVYEVIERALEISGMSSGAFDITVAGIGGLWSFDPERPRIASPEEIAKRLPLISWKDVVLDKPNHAVGLARAGMRINLNAIAKGYAVDRAIDALVRRGVEMAMVNAGGDLRVIGSRAKRPWHVGIEHPRKPGNLIGWLPVTDRAVATSGDYEKFIEKNGKRYCHIIDPKTAKPASSCQSVTVVAGETWLADALATAVFVMGPKKGMEMVEDMAGVQAVIIDSQGLRTQSTGIKGGIHWSQ